MPVIQLGENTSIVGTYYKSLYDADDFHIIDMQAPYTEGKFPTAHTTKEVTFTAKESSLLLTIRGRLWR